MGNEIIKVLDSLCDKFGVAIDWSSKTVLPYLKELSSRIVAYELWTSILWTIVFTSVIIAFVAVVKKSFAKNEDGENVWESYDGEDFYLAAILILGFASVIGLVVIGFQVNEIIACRAFPEKIVLDYITAITKK